MYLFFGNGLLCCEVAEVAEGGFSLLAFGLVGRDFLLAEILLGGILWRAVRRAIESVGGDRTVVRFLSLGVSIWDAGGDVFVGVFEAGV